MEKLRKLTQMTEHPEQYTEEEWQEVFGGETVGQEQIDRAWQHFEAKHLHRPSRLILKMAASFVGILLLSGIAVAALLYTRQAPPLPTEIVKPEARVERQAVPAPASSIQEPHTVVFEDAELQQIIDSLTFYYKVKPGYRRESARRLRLYYEWNQRNSIGQTVDEMSHFSRFGISLKGDSIIIE